MCHRELVVVARKKVVPSNVIPPADGRFKLKEKETEETMLVLLKPCAEGSEVDAKTSRTLQEGTLLQGVEAHSKDAKSPSVASDGERDMLVSKSQEKKGLIASHPPGSHNVFTHDPKDPYCEQCKKSKTSQARCKTRSKKRMDDVERFAKFGDLITADH